MTTLPVVSPFSCGTQYADWTEANCMTCDKGWRPDRDSECDIEQALSFACIDDGTVPAEIADRMGRGEGRYNWPCREHQPPFVNVRPDGTVDPSVKQPGEANRADAP